MRLIDARILILISRDVLTCTSTWWHGCVLSPAHAQVSSPTERLAQLRTFSASHALSIEPLENVHTCIGQREVSQSRCLPLSPVTANFRQCFPAPNQHSNTLGSPCPNTASSLDTQRPPPTPRALTPTHAPRSPAGLPPGLARSALPSQRCLPWISPGKPHLKKAICRESTDEMGSHYQRHSSSAL